MTRVNNDSGFDDLEELRKRFEEFRNQHQSRTRLPEELWHAAAEIAGRHGMNLVCRRLRLDANSLKLNILQSSQANSARSRADRVFAQDSIPSIGTAGFPSTPKDSSDGNVSMSTHKFV